MTQTPQGGMIFLIDSAKPIEIVGRTSAYGRLHAEFEADFYSFVTYDSR
jgi:hypothetical protein